MSNFTITPTIGPVTVPPLIPIDGTETDGGDGDLDEDGEDGVDGEDEDEDEDEEDEDEDGEDIPDDEDELDEITHDDDSDDGDSDAVMTTVVVNGTTIVGTVPAATTTQTVTQTVGAGASAAAAGATGSIGGSELDGAGSVPQVQGQALGETQGSEQPVDAFPTGLGVQDPNSFTAKAKARRHRRHRKRGIPVFSPLAAGPGPGAIPSPPDANIQLVREVTDDTLSDSLSIERVGVVPVSNGAVGMRPGSEAVSVGGMLGMLACVGVAVGVVGAAVGVY